MPNWPSIAAQFNLSGDILSAEPLGHGHIHDTYRLALTERGAERSYTLQRLNITIFRNPAALMDNIARVTAHLHRKNNGAPDAHRHALQPVAARDGGWLATTENGAVWRAFHFIGRAYAPDILESRDQAYQAARAFGRFQGQLADLPPPRLTEILPDFHHTPKRFMAFERALAADAHQRADAARPEIAFALSRRTMTTVLLDLQGRGEIPERVVHNDTKINNILFDESSGEAICVIDLDIVMPGLALYDFGDLVRSASNPAAEDERDLSRVVFRLPFFAALLRGYLETAGAFLTPAERRHLAFAGPLITLEVGLRFLTDYLDGDKYFKVQRPNHNLDRARTQFKLVADMERHRDAMQAIVDAG